MIEGNTIASSNVALEEATIEVALLDADDELLEDVEAELLEELDELLEGSSLEDEISELSLEEESEMLVVSLLTLLSTLKELGKPLEAQPDTVNRAMMAIRM